MLKPKSIIEILKIMLTDGKVGIAVGDDNLFSFNQFVNGNNPPSGRHHTTVT